MQYSINREIERQARALHYKLYPEEFDAQFDSYADAQDRAKGINPMSAEYIEAVSAKREKLGVSPLSVAGLPISDDTYQACLREALRQDH